MNQLCALTCTVVRSYSRRTRIKPDTAGLRRKIELEKEVDGSSATIDMEDNDFDDLSQLESDFTDVHKSYAAHQWQMEKAREKLQQDITADKYFKVTDPSFLTLTDRDKIKRLHAKDPEEWTVERLSETFPALPDTIAKILKDKWRPATVERVLKYDKKVLENWKKFQAGKLPVSDALKSHLLTFGDRASKINLKHSEKIAKFLITPKIEIPKPKHNIFVQLVTPAAETEPEQVLLPAKGKSSHEETNVKNLQKVESNQSTTVKEKAERLTFTEFAEQKFEKIYEESEKEAAVLANAYAKQSNIISKANAREQTLEDLDETNETEPIDEQKAENTLQTYVVKKETIQDAPTTYIYSIKIPKGAYRKGKTYRVHDCYYDDDGEFLYRIPGLKR